MKILLSIVFGFIGYLVLGPIGALCGVLIGLFTGGGSQEKSDNPALDSAMEKVRREGEARRAARREKL